MNKRVEVMVGKDLGMYVQKPFYSENSGQEYYIWQRQNQSMGVAQC
jgi:hypothetical protein